MKLYYGSTVIVKGPEIEEPNYKNSFGKGFFTSVDKDTAEYWAEVKKQRELEKDKTLTIKKYINVYEFTENEKLNILDFEKVNESDYVFNEENKTNSENSQSYDIVKGPEITDKLARILKDYKNKKLKKEDLLNMLLIYKTINEVSFHTEEALKTLKFLYAEEIES